jgi:cytochrome c biogenesis protein CcdA
MKSSISSRITFFHALALVLGFTAIFTLLGASVGLLGGYALYDALPVITRVGAILLIVFSLKVAHVKMNYLGWVVAALFFGAMTFWLDKYQFESSHRLINALIVALAVFSGAQWEKMILLVLGILVGGLSFLTSGAPVAWLKALEMLLIVVTVYYGNLTDVFDREFRMDMGGKFGSEASYWRSALVGVIFAAGWTPCVGPILSGILLLAAQEQTWVQGAILLTAYSAGLGVPFLIAGALFSKLTAYLPKFYKWLPTISLISGILLIFIALLLFTDTLSRLSQFGGFLNFEQDLASEGGGAQISLLFAFLGGLVSFLSPCVLPLVPAYLGYLSGAVFGAAAASSEA